MSQRRNRQYRRKLLWGPGERRVIGLFVLPGRCLALHCQRGQHARCESNVCPCPCHHRKESAP